MIGDIAIDIGFFENFASIDDIKRKYNQIVDLFKFSPNKKILSRVVVLGCNLICSQTLVNYFIIIIFFLRNRTKPENFIKKLKNLQKQKRLHQTEQIPSKLTKEMKAMLSRPKHV